MATDRGDEHRHILNAFDAGVEDYLKLECHTRYDLELGELIENDGAVKRVIEVRRQILDDILRRAVIIELEKLGYTVLPPPRFT